MSGGSVKCLPRSPCRRCGKAHSNRNGYCDQHQEYAVGWVVRQKVKTTTERGYGHAWRKLRAIILARDKHCCVPCSIKGFVAVAHAVDHIIPKENGGTDLHSNLQAICKDCHAEKTKGESIKGRKKW